MFISAREKLIVEILLDKREELTIKDLAEKIDVSPRTIHRDLKGIEKLLNEYDLGLIRKTGVGIQITGPEESKENLKRKLMTLTLQDYLADERQTLILCTLYEAAGPVKLFTLANELRVTVATISADLIKLEEQLEHFQLSILRKRGYGVELSGPEKAKRRAISYVIAKSLKEDEFLSLIEDSLGKKFAVQENAISERLLHLVDREKLLVIEDVMRELKNDTLISITDNAYVGLIVHLALAIERIKQGEKIEMNADFLNQLKQEPEYETARKIINQLISRFNIEIPEAEIGYITMHLQGAKLRENEENLPEIPSLPIVMQTKKLIENVEEISGYHLTNNAPLLEGLITHLRPALYRIEQNMGITNPLLQSIRKDYKDLFQIVTEACEKTFLDLKIPDEEIGYLVMHFGSAILGLTGKNNLKAYVVCSSGIGTSKMLATQLRREIREIEEVRNVSVFELNELQISDRDLVISTIHLEDFPYEYITVSPFLTVEEVNQIGLYVKRKMLIKTSSPELKKQDSNVEAIAARMERIHFYTGAAADLLDGFQLTIEREAVPLKTCIRKLCENLEKEEVVQNAEVITEALFAREAMGGVGIPDTKLALFHTKHEQVLKSSFTVHTLREPIVMKAMDGNNIEISRVLLLLSPNPYHEPGLEVLSLISTLIIESEHSIELFESEDEKVIHSYLGSKLEQFVDEIIKN
ncbi:BglG family transcription antiterminator [Sporosarcina sp. Marseille-Q4063]|uniref:BglG family transcription antiterminator n=1 Tax=Sporosarcina sp. Marseille-Q4063 TaxID=2810514 RepID=UPI001BAE96D0|nr:BglG family transcription antiterminator [Sporosarcina sp. Marseille-Q4063]QUW22870.1 BglG family transcription antiterminator [Sporosarcina sp. Marseille-Q4063]